MIPNSPARVAALASFVILATVGQTALVAQGSRYSLRLENRSRYDIYHLYVSSSEYGTWGPDLLGSSVLRSGSAFTVTDITTGEYDIRFVDQDGDQCVLRRIQVTQNSVWRLTTEWLLQCEGYGGQPTHRLSIQNNSSFIIHRIHLSPSESTTWGPDSLGAGLLRTGYRHTITDIRAGRYDIKFVDQDGDECVLRGFNIAENLSWTLTNDVLLRCEGYAGRRGEE